MEICSGILTSLITLTVSFFSSEAVSFLFSFNLALFTDAKLLCLISISSTFIALETVSLKSLRADCGPSFNLVLLETFSSFFLIKFLVACCSTNFLTIFCFGASARASGVVVYA